MKRRISYEHERIRAAYLSIQRSSGVLIASSRYTNAPAKRRDVPDKSTTLLIRYFREGGLSPGLWEGRGDMKSARGPEIRRDNVLEMDIRRTWVVVTVSADVERDLMPDVDS